MIKTTGSQNSNNKELLKTLLKDVNTESCSVWALTRVKAIEPIAEQCVRELIKLEPIKYIRISADSIIASSEISGGRIRNPITTPFHNTAIGIHIVFSFRYKTLEFYEINSSIKGWGGKMVEATIKNLPAEWQPTLVFDYSNGFWEKMKIKYDNLKWIFI
jgi:hypothetical protein